MGRMKSLVERQDEIYKKRIEQAERRNSITYVQPFNSMGTCIPQFSIGKGKDYSWRDSKKSQSQKIRSAKRKAGR